MEIIGNLTNERKYELYNFIINSPSIRAIAYKFKELGVIHTRSMVKYVLENIEIFFYHFIKTIKASPVYHTLGEDFNFNKVQDLSEEDLKDFSLHPEWKIKPFTYPEEKFDKNKYYKLVNIDPYKVKNDHLIKII